MATAVPAPERILPTLNPDGSRNRIRPKLFKGRYYRARLFVAWGLLVTFIALPFIKVGGTQSLLLDVGERQFHFFGVTLLSTDAVLAMLLVLAVFVGIFLISALLGRVWCGWACPQTVYMEFVFRPLERLFEGSRLDQLKLDREGANGRRVAKIIVFAVLSVVLGNVFVSYFVGMDALLGWVWSSPAERPVAFTAMAITSILVFVDFAYFREQMCTVACPYARLQAVLLDRRSLVVGYDALRGEPRAKKPRADSGACVDCNNCVVACPTGIDIRNGLQLDCIACAQCVDACDWVMDKMKQPRGLVRYGSTEALEGAAKGRILRPRVVLYSLLLGVFLSVLLVVSLRQGSADVTILRGLGTPYVVDGDSVRNLIRIKVENRSDVVREYRIELEGANVARFIAPENPLKVPARTHQSTTVFVIGDAQLFKDGAVPVKFRVTDGDKFDRKFDYKLIGPRTLPPRAAPDAGAGS
jgi:cytochrome c oxidase accessory protein FixG